MTRFYIFCIFILVLFCSSCKENFFDSSIEVKVPEHEPQLTVTAHLFDGSPEHWVYVNHSSGILDSTTITSVTDATVELYEGDNLIKNFPFKKDDHRKLYGAYVSDSISFTPDKTYTLKIESIEYGALESSQTVPSKVLINNASFEKEGAIDRYGERVDEISVEFDDPKGEKNYYTVSVWGAYLFENQDTSFLRPNWFFKERPVDPILEEVGYRLFFSDASLDGKNYTMKLGVLADEQITYSIENGVLMRAGKGESITATLISLTITLNSISRDYYSFYKSLETFEDNQDNFFAEPTNVYENVEGGIGIFTVNSRDEYVIEF